MERRANKKKLSKHLLEMKFMKRYREKTEIMDEEEIRSQMFDSEVTPTMRVEGDRFITEPSYVAIENLRFGRFSYKGMNPEIENIMLEDATKEEAARPSDIKDISDMEMAEHFGNLRGTMEKKFTKKRDAGGKRSGTPSTTTSTTANVIAQTSQFLAQVRLETEQAAPNKKSKFKKPSEDE
jgi:M-phase phosphoprotein-6